MIGKTRVYRTSWQVDKNVHKLNQSLYDDEYTKWVNIVVCELNLSETQKHRNLDIIQMSTCQHE